ncbi:DnaB-like helicase C-terminal domain-containing protein, partial [Intestinibacter sp.]|uniref:DnaB-like helicase C-terminal domain-containing protein n=1 Tax=Intestinibacter sp. TaxID=1965304 RepID=UPI003F14D350
KTSLALYSYIYRPIMENIDNKNFHIIYYSLEMSCEALFTKLLSIYMYERFGKEISYKELLSRKRNYSLSDEDFELVLQCEDWLNRIEEIITVYDRGLTADRMYAHLIGELSKYGEFEETETRKVFIPKDKNQIILVVIDHLGLIRKDKGRTKKEEMDLASSYLVTLRNKCGISPLVLMQMNRDSSSVDRRKNSWSEPQLNDIKDTGNVSEDAEIVISIFHPYREKLTTYRGYKLNILENTYRAIIVLKNRYGDNGVAISTAFYGKSGIWRELPKPEEINDYEQYLTIDGKCKDENINTEIDEKEEIKNDFKIIM